MEPHVKVVHHHPSPFANFAVNESNFHSLLGMLVAEYDREPDRFRILPDELVRLVFNFVMGGLYRVSQTSFANQLGIKQTVFSNWLNQRKGHRQSRDAVFALFRDCYSSTASSQNLTPLTLPIEKIKLAVASRASFSDAETNSTEGSRSGDYGFIPAINVIPGKHYAIMSTPLSSSSSNLSEVDDQAFPPTMSDYGIRKAALDPALIQSAPLNLSGSKIKPPGFDPVTSPSDPGLVANINPPNKLKESDLFQSRDDSEFQNLIQKANESFAQGKLTPHTSPMNTNYPEGSNPLSLSGPKSNTSISPMFLINTAPSHFGYKVTSGPTGDETALVRLRSDESEFLPISEASQTISTKAHSLKLIIIIDCERAVNALDEIILISPNEADVHVFAFLSSKDMSLVERLSKLKYDWLTLVISNWVTDIYEHAISMETVHFHYFLYQYPHLASLPFLLVSNSPPIFELSYRLKSFRRPNFVFNINASIAYYLANFKTLDGSSIGFKSPLVRSLKCDVVAKCRTEKECVNLLSPFDRSGRIAYATFSELSGSVKAVIDKFEEDGSLEPARADIISKLIRASKDRRLSLSSLGAQLTLTIQERRWNGWLAIFQNEKNQRMVGAELVRFGEEYFLVAK